MVNIVIPQEKLLATHIRANCGCGKFKPAHNSPSSPQATIQEVVSERITQAIQHSVDNAHTVEMFIEVRPLFELQREGTDGDA